MQPKTGFRCTICNKDYLGENLDRHMRLHKGMDQDQVIIRYDR